MKSLLQLLHPNILLPDTALPAEEADHTVFFVFIIIYTVDFRSVVWWGKMSHIFPSKHNTYILILLAACLCLHLLFKGDTFRFVVTLMVTEKYEIHLILPNPSYLAMGLK